MRTFTSIPRRGPREWRPLLASERYAPSVRVGEAREQRQHLFAFGRRPLERDQLLALVDREHDLATTASRNP
jgi:hypothetical protein